MGRSDAKVRVSTAGGSPAPHSTAPLPAAATAVPDFTRPTGQLLASQPWACARPHCARATAGLAGSSVSSPRPPDYLSNVQNCPSLQLPRSPSKRRQLGGSPTSLQSCHHLGLGLVSSFEAAAKSSLICSLPLVSLDVRQCVCLLNFSGDIGDGWTAAHLAGRCPWLSSPHPPLLRPPCTPHSSPHLPPPAHRGCTTAQASCVRAVLLLSRGLGGSSGLLYADTCSPPHAEPSEPRLVPQLRQLSDGTQLISNIASSSFFK